MAFEYMHHPNIEVILIGDKLSKNSQITVGGGAISQIRQLKADICFVGTNAIDLEHGLTDNDWEVVQVKKAMIEASKKIVSLTISEKLNSTQPIRVCEIKDIDILVTELNEDDKNIKPYKKSGLTIL